MCLSRIRRLNRLAQLFTHLIFVYITLNYEQSTQPHGRYIIHLKQISLPFNHMNQLCPDETIIKTGGVQTILGVIFFTISLKAFPLLLPPELAVLRYGVYKSGVTTSYLQLLFQLSTFPILDCDAETLYCSFFICKV